MKRTGWVFLLLLFTPALHALDVTVPGSFTISGVTRTDGKVMLPAERTYQNIRILDKSTYRFVSSCPEPCVQPLGSVSPVVADVRPAQTRAGMWIVSVDFNRAWRITFLVFKKGNDFSIKLPQYFTFLSDPLRTQTREVVLQAVLQEENEMHAR